MTMLKVVEILAQSEKSWADAAQLAVQEAAKTVRNIKSIYVKEAIYVKEMEATVENDRITPTARSITPTARSIKRRCRPTRSLHAGWALTGC
jgi:dodecin